MKIRVAVVIPCVVVLLALVSTPALLRGVGQPVAAPAALRAAHPGAAPPQVPGADVAVPTIARLRYGGGGDWYTGPSTLVNLLHAIRTRTGLPVASRPVQVSLTDPDLWSYPYLFITGHGNIHFTDAEVRDLRAYLLHGGFLHADDDYGMDKSFRREIKRVFPHDSLVDVPLSYPIYHIFYNFPKGLPKIEYHDGQPAEGLGIFHDGRLVVFYSYDSDLGDGWEDEDVNHPGEALREQALRMGVNIYLFAISQVVR